MSLHTRKYPKLLHIGVFPLHPPLGKHLLTAGPTIAYPGLQRYLTYSPAQWFLFRLITRTALSTSPGSPQSRKTANKKRRRSKKTKQKQQQHYYNNKTRILQSISALKQLCISYQLNIKLSVPGFQTIWNGTNWNKNRQRQQHQKLRGSERVSLRFLSIQHPPSCSLISCIFVFATRFRWTPGTGLL